MEILQDVVKVARKPHRCCLCGCDIKPGQMYASQRCVEDGEFWEATLRRVRLPQRRIIGKEHRGYARRSRQRLVQRKG